MSDAADAKAAMADAKHASEVFKREKIEANIAELEMKAATPIQVYVEEPREDGGSGAGERDESYDSPRMSGADVG